MKRAVFRLPNEDSFLLCNENIEKEKHILFSNFSGETKVFFPADIDLIDNIDDVNDSFFNDVIFSESNSSIKFPDEKEYTEKIEETIKILKENNLEKLVISRPLKHNFSSIDLKQSFLKLCKKYPNALCYLLITEDQIWIGATPELLGKFDKKSNQFETMSLAGTLPLNESWSEKEIQEQQSVTKHIASILAKHTTDITQSKTIDHISGNIKHLRTDFSATLKQEDLNILINDLHPTPAICGIPTEFCQRKIQEIENYNRSLYTGIISLETDNDKYYFVNLRCAHILKNHCIIYVGGGINNKSIPSKEWQETELKSLAIKENIVENSI